MTFDNKKLTESERLWLNSLEEGAVVEIDTLSSNLPSIPKGTLSSWKSKGYIPTIDDSFVVGDPMRDRINHWFPVNRKKKEKKEKGEKKEDKKEYKEVKGNPASITSMADELLEMAAKLEKYAKVITKFDQAFSALREIE